MEVSKRYKKWLKDGGNPWDFDATGIGLRLGMDAAWHHIQQIGIKPTYITNSGGGFHTFFVFNKKYDINNKKIE